MKALNQGETAMIRERISINPSDPAAWLEAMAEPSDTPRPAMLIIPGGGYAHVCYDREGWDIADAFMKHGMNCFVLNYRVGPEYKYPEHLIDAALSMDYIRKNAAKYSVDPDRVYVVGFSAGGHLVGLISTKHKEAEKLLGLPENATRPSGSVYCYPVISTFCPTHGGSFYNLTGKQVSDLTPEEASFYSIDTNVTPDTPPAFIWHTAEDQAVPVYNSLLLANAYIKAGIPMSLRIYPYGPHGIALATKQTWKENPDFIQPLAQGWVDDAAEFLKTIG